MTILEYFNSAIGMDSGDTLLIPCENENEQETVRTRLFFLRRRARGDSLSIYKVEDKNKLFVAIKKLDFKKAFILKSSGELVDVKEHTIAENDLEHIIKLSLKDNIPLEELIEGFGGVFSPEGIEKEYNKQKAELE